MKALSEEFKPIGMRNYEFENRQNKNTNWIFSHVQQINISVYGITGYFIKEKFETINHRQFRDW